MSNARLALLLALVIDVLFFSTLLGAFIVFRFSSATPLLWPDKLTSVNAVVLIVSVIVLWMSGRMRPPLKASWMIFALIFILSHLADSWPLFHRSLGALREPATTLLVVLITLQAIHLVPAIGLAGTAIAKPTSYAAAARLSWTFVAGLWLMIFAILQLR